MPATAAGTWYLHVQGYNGQDMPNGTYDCDVNIGGVGVAADLDCDSDVDQADFTRFELCMSGPGIAYTGDCARVDFNQDSDVDQADFGVFQRCYSGEDVSPDPSCAG